ncbi:MerR family transcriptional regulator [Peribacillus sp. SCS-26]|uniref:MerR family transcriptional regulator n=1 Tax=Paraperibacillus marinus TaxID=3115295 RepID=UPI00390590B9
MAHVTKRTIDYYTNQGLLTAERSASNYRYYCPGAVEKIGMIEQLKKEKLSLAEIKKRLKEQDTKNIDIEELKARIQELELDVSEIMEIVEKQGLTKETIKNNLSHESISLMQTLLLLLI